MCQAEHQPSVPQHLTSAQNISALFFPSPRESCSHTLWCTCAQVQELHHIQRLLQVAQKWRQETPASVIPVLVDFHFSEISKDAGNSSPVAPIMTKEVERPGMALDQLCIEVRIALVVTVPTLTLAESHVVCFRHSDATTAV